MLPTAQRTGSRVAEDRAFLEHQLRVGDIEAARRCIAALEARGTSPFVPWFAAAKETVWCATIGCSSDGVGHSSSVIASSAVAAAVSRGQQGWFRKPDLLHEKERATATSVVHLKCPQSPTFCNRPTPTAGTPAAADAALLTPEEIDAVLSSPLSPLSLRQRIALLEQAAADRRQTIAKHERHELASIFTAAILHIEELRCERERASLRVLECEESQQRAAHESEAALSHVAIGCLFQRECDLAKVRGVLCDDERRWRAREERCESRDRRALLLEFIRGADVLRVDGRRVRGFDAAFAQMDFLAKTVGGPPQGGGGGGGGGGSSSLWKRT